MPCLPECTLMLSIWIVPAWPTTGKYISGNAYTICPVRVWYSLRWPLCGFQKTHKVKTIEWILCVGGDGWFPRPHHCHWCAKGIISLWLLNTRNHKCALRSVPLFNSMKYKFISREFDFTHRSTLWCTYYYDKWVVHCVNDRASSYQIADK